MQHYKVGRPSLEVYPGNYVPKYTTDEIRQELRNTNTSFSHAPVKMKEMKDFYHIEIEIPGAKSEDFTLQIDDNILSINMLHKEEEHFDGESFSVKNLKSVCFNKKIALPNDADTIFIVAEYKAGILNLLFPKTTETEQNKSLHTDVVVY